MRKLGSVALVALLTLVPVSTASAKSKAEAFAAKHRLSGSWKGKDVDKDGLKNLQEFKLKTDPRKADTDKDALKDGDEVESGNNPRKADTDGDGTKDGAEHAGEVTAFDGETITIREFATGKKVTATLDTECTPAPADDEDVAADDSTFVDVTEEAGQFFQEEEADDDGVEEEVDVDAETSSCDDDEDLEKGVVLQSAELEDGFLVAYELA
ncbi:hypothetical protein DVA67_025190 [Solirubrobacter sp. CPCC 204708]|uniref:EF-hand domain-containing protein n=1 Tax=Solirubrobacter deserti TaxID=2282478 RepID=A0ABT4RRY9_9ACTN|nr:hypothetical protein [Solirubrobacter deserti]MBE2319297.1 hypothetical protein [Solirubrobacter deserti]MDA0141163.1 hypothetical protein [Solirubrobacter deserti]